MRLRDFLEDRSWAELGKGIAYTIPVAFMLIIFYQNNPDVLSQLSSKQDLETTMDVFAHMFAAAGLAGLFSGVFASSKSGMLRKRQIFFGCIVSLLLMIPVWETFEDAVNVYGTEDYLKDVVSDVLGILTYGTLEFVRRLLGRRLKNI